MCGVLQLLQLSISRDVIMAKPFDSDQVFLTTEELAARWRCDKHTLSNARHTGRGLPFIKLPTGAVRYALSDVLQAEIDGRRGYTRENVDAALDACKHLDAASREKVKRWLAERLG